MSNNSNSECSHVDQNLAKEMTQYWKDHIQEEKRRTGKAS